jgi:hypothetical protein
VNVISKKFPNVNEATHQEQESASHRVQLEQNAGNPTKKINYQNNKSFLELE